MGETITLPVFSSKFQPNLISYAAATTRLSGGSFVAESRH
jgi:hypothetical protein